MKARSDGSWASENSGFGLVVVPFLKSNHVIRRGFGILPDVFNYCGRLIGIIDERPGANCFPCCPSSICLVFPRYPLFCPCATVLTNPSNALNSSVEKSLSPMSTMKLPSEKQPAPIIR